MLNVVGDVTEVKAGLARYLDVGIFLQRFDIRRARVERDLAFPGTKLLRTDRGVGRDRENQVIDLHVFGFPIFLVALEADLSVFLVAAEHERPSANRLLVDLFTVAGFEQLIGIFS